MILNKYFFTKIMIENEKKTNRYKSQLPIINFDTHLYGFNIDNYLKSEK